MSNEIKTRPLTPTEQKYTYAQSMQLEGQTGTIGHLRGDFATTGYGFYTTWFDTRPQWKSDEFKADLDTVINALREDKGLLHNRYDMSAFARHFPESAIKGNYPQTIKEYEERIAGYENDAALAEQHKPQGEDKFCSMTLKGVTYTEKADAGEMLLAICKDYPMSAPTEIGSYRGFRMEIYYDTVNAHYCMNLCGKAKHKVDLGADALGNLTRIENELSKLPARLEAAKTKKAETIAQLEIAKEEIKKPFAFEDELKEKTERLNALNIELNLNEKDTSVMDTEPEQAKEQPERKCASRER